MPDTYTQLASQNAALTRQLLEWVASGRHTYAETLEVWHSHCPRHTIWEDALEAGLVDCAGGRDDVVVLTRAGERALREPSR
jgi:ClpP class serine protease